jgi:predicted nuclease of restriction endonuclease-like (RecB) superfamily
MNNHNDSSVQNLIGYEDFLNNLKTKIRSAQIKAALSVNRELIALYWEIGKAIAEKQEKHGWGFAVVDQLAKDLQHEFPNIQGFSRRNLYYIRTFYLTYYNELELVQQLVAQFGKMDFLLILNQIINLRILDSSFRWNDNKRD